MRKSGGKVTKFVPLDTADIAQERFLLPGRHPCTCEASKHKLILNCLKCGRIVCEQEGSGPCYTCGHLVCTPKEQEIIMRQSKQSFKLYHKLMNADTSSESTSIPVTNDDKLQKALKHRDKLLEFDKNVEKRTKVIDDENDYFQTNSQWLSSKERKILDKKREEMQELSQRKTFTFDFAGRKVVEEKPQINFDPDELLKSDTSIFECEDSEFLDIPLEIQPVYYEDSEHHYESSHNENINKRLQLRIQDKELQEMSDDGICLSMHQPHASLLISGIKKHEGRVWYSSYRGRLWIHAATKVPKQQEIEHIEHFYRSNQGECCFPKNYPSGCLLGCVDIVDCLPQEEYKIQFPDGENASPYVFICENPQELLIKIPMKGKHKLFKLDSNVHQAAKKMISRLRS